MLSHADDKDHRPSLLLAPASPRARSVSYSNIGKWNVDNAQEKNNAISLIEHFASRSSLAPLCGACAFIIFHLRMPCSGAGAPDACMQPGPGRVLPLTAGQCVSPATRRRPAGLRDCLHVLLYYLLLPVAPATSPSISCRWNETETSACVLSACTTYGWGHACNAAFTLRCVSLLIDRSRLPCRRSVRVPGRPVCVSACVCMYHPAVACNVAFKLLADLSPVSHHENAVQWLPHWCSLQKNCFYEGHC